MTFGSLFLPSKNCNVHNATPSEIAGALGLAASTVSSHIARIRTKLDARSLGDLVRYAVKSGLVE